MTTPADDLKPITSMAVAIVHVATQPTLRLAGIDLDSGQRLTIEIIADDEASDCPPNTDGLVLTMALGRTD